MLNIPKNLKKPERKDYKVSDYELETFQNAKKQLGNERYERKKKNENSSCLLAIAATWIVAFVILSMISSKDFNPLATIFITTVIAAIIGPFIGGFFMSAAEKTVDAVTYEPTINWMPNQTATKAYDDAMEKYNNTIDNLKRRYPDIEKVDYDADRYTEYVTNELAHLINSTFNSDNIKWWRDQVLNFKSCIIKVLVKLGYEEIRRTDNVRDPIDASRSYTYDVSASRDGETVLVRCFNETNGELTLGHIMALRDALSEFERTKAILATTYRAEKISGEILEYAQLHDIEIWDMNRLLELTRDLFLNKDGEPPIDLPSGFIHQLSYSISRSIGAGLLAIRPYHYYILMDELFENQKDALTKISTYPRGKIYYGVCEYPRKWQYRGGTCIYGVIACYSEDGTVWRLAKECGYMFDAERRDYITNKHQDNLGNRSKYIPSWY